MVVEVQDACAVDQFHPGSAGERKWLTLNGKGVKGKLTLCYGVQFLSSTTSG
jgi:hypothetical protein